MRRRAGPITGWQPGDVLRVTEVVRNHTKPDSPLSPGTLVTLGAFQRVQDGYECWVVWQGAKSWGICHTQLEPACGPVRRLSPLGSL